MYCSKCGKEISDDSKFCPFCCEPVNKVYNDNKPVVTINKGRSKLVAGLLNIFIPFGVGRIYAGYTGIGIAQLLVTLFTCGLGSLWPFIDGILILTGTPNVDGNGQIWTD